MRKNGFIATSILYAFFLVFLTLFLALVANYLHNQILISKIENDAAMKLIKINETKLKDLKAGDFVIIPKGSNDIGNVLSGMGKWVVGYKDDDNIYLLSDTTVPNPKIKVFIINRVRETTLSINSFNAALEEDPPLYVESMAFNYDPSNINNIQKASNGEYKISVSIPTASKLSLFRNQPYDDFVKSAIFNDNASYIIYDDYANIYKYYEKKSFSHIGEDTSSCNGTLNPSGLPTYTNNYGFIHVDTDALSNSKFIDYCYFPSDEVVELDSAYDFRLMAKIPYRYINDEISYLAGGKGLITDPYILTNGVK